MLADVTPFLCCPVCGRPLRHAGSALLCAGGHGFDVARQGYVNLLAGRARHGDADTTAMVDARARFLAGGHYEPLADVLAAQTHQAIAGLPGDVCVLDCGAGIGYYLARVLDVCAGRPGIALDASKHAARRAARAHPRIGAVVADLWKQLPIRSGATGVALVVFAPRNPAELHRVLNGRGRLIVVTPAPQHLAEVAEPLGLLRIQEDKAGRLSAQLGQHFEPAGLQMLERKLRLGESSLRALAMMGPSAWHISAEDLGKRIDRLGRAADVTAAFTLSSYRPLGT